MADAHANFATSLVATAPSPATSGTSLVVTAGQGALFPAVPFNATICPAATAPTTTNAEIVRVTAVSTDALTITRAQEGTSARTVVVGDQIFAGITAKTLTDVELAPQNPLRVSGVLYESFDPYLVATAGLSQSGRSGTLVRTAIALPSGLTIGHLAFAFTASGSGYSHSWFGLYDSAGVQLAVTADRGSTTFSNSAMVSVAIATIASGAASTFTTTYSGLYYVGFVAVATTMPSALGASGNAPGQVTAVTPQRVGTSDTGLTTPTAFPHTIAAGTALANALYCQVAA